MRVLVSVAKSGSRSLKADWRTRGQIQDIAITQGGLEYKEQIEDILIHR